MKSIISACLLASAAAANTVSVYGTKTKTCGGSAVATVSANNGACVDIVAGGITNSFMGACFNGYYLGALFGAGGCKMNDYLSDAAGPNNGCNNVGSNSYDFKVSCGNDSLSPTAMGTATAYADSGCKQPLADAFAGNGVCQAVSVPGSNAKSGIGAIYNLNGGTVFAMGIYNQDGCNGTPAFFQVGETGKCYDLNGIFVKVESTGSPNGVASTTASMLAAGAAAAVAGYMAL